jgi:hypothetical protein
LGLFALYFSSYLLEKKREADRDVGTVAWLWRGVIGYCMQRNAADPTQLSLFEHLAKNCC